MSCNPCCCLKLKDAAVTIGIWSTIYALAQIAVFGWQFSVLAQCQHVIMAQSNLQCDYYCPCVGASTARTSAIIEGMVYSIMQLGIFGWQMAAIKYEKDRAANTLLPNYNTYGRYDIPTYYESYWQSPEERYYTWLFVIQILCLITAFFLLFASIMMIYGVHTWSRYLLVPWMVTMCASILTSLAYCIMWWAGDVRDYWLMLTIVEMFGVFINAYCFVVIAVFHRRMVDELNHYARRQKYNHLNQPRPRGSPQHTIEQELVDSGGEELGRKPAPSPLRRPPAGQIPYQYSPAGQPIPPRQEIQIGQPFGHQRTPMERFQQEAIIPPPPPFVAEQQRPRSALERPFPSQYAEFHRQRRPSSHRHRSKCRHCGRAHWGRQHRCHHCHHRAEHCHCHHAPIRPRKYSCSSMCSMANYGEVPSDEEKFDRKRSKSSRRRRKQQRRSWSEQESEELSEFAASVQSEQQPNYGNISMLERQQRPGSESRRRSLERRKRKVPTPAAPICPLSLPSQGISIPQHIVIPPMSSANGAQNPQAERQYRINSEITIHYDQHGRAATNRREGPPPAIPPRHNGLMGPRPEPIGSIQARNFFGDSSILRPQEGPVPMERRNQRQQPLSITSNV